MRNEKGQFVKGTPCDLTAEQKLKRSASIRENARKLPGYIGDLKDKYPKMYNHWRAFRFTDKGKAAGCSNDWLNFRTFFNDTFPSYKPGLLLRRRDTKQPWSKENFMWVTQEEANMTLSRTMFTFNGETRTLKDWSNFYQIPYRQLYQRYRKGLGTRTPEEIMFGRKKDRGTKTPRDYTDSRVSIRAKASKMLSSYRHIDLVNNTERCDMSIDWMIENILTQPCHYCGDTKRIGCDRIDNNRGHTKDNVVPCCIECNTARNKFFTYEEMHRLGAAIAEIKRSRKTTNTQTQ